MRIRRLLLATSALSSFALGCSKEQPAREPEPLPGNPKGTRYDAALDPDAALPDATAAVAPVDAGAPTAADATTGDAGVPDAKAPTTLPRNIPEVRGNPKGSRYDDGLNPSLVPPKPR